MYNIDETIRRVTKALRARLADANESSFRFEVEVSGRVQEGEVKITYTLSDSLYGSNKVEGGNIDAVLAEFLRRKGWIIANQPLMLEGPPPANDIDPVEPPRADAGAF